MAFTKEQQMAIDYEGENIIVSAGAGSGKTAVLTERVIRKLRDGVPVNKLLVLTFTNEAANEMKSRIRKAIIKNNLTEQLELLDSSYITTFDSYALSLVKKYHYLLNIDKDLKITQNGVIKVFKYKTLDKIFDNMYGDDKFEKLINDFCLKDDYLVKEFVMQIDDKLELLTNKGEYLDGYMANYYSDYYLDNVTNEYLDLVKNTISEIHDLYNELSNYASDSLISKLDSYFKPLFTGNSYQEYLLFKTLPTVRFVGLDKAGIPIKDELKTKVTLINDLLRFDSFDNIRKTILSTKEYMEVIIDIINKLDNEVNSYKDRHSIYEFNDISHMANMLVRDYIDIREEIKGYFNEIMVDEYQDTSNIQEEFINYIANNNLYMVGDIKQSIYRFRNANPYIFRDKYNLYSKHDGGMKIDLLKNFRSRHETLDNINEIFNLIMDENIGDADYQKSHNMVYGNTLYDNEDTGVNNKLEIYNYQMEDDDKYTKEEKELFIIAKDIDEKIRNNYQVFDKDTGKLRNMRYSDICIITDRNKHLVKYKKILEYHEIPAVIYMDGELYNDVVIMAIKNLIELVYLVNNNDCGDKFRYVLTSVMRSFIGNYPDDFIFNVLKNKEYNILEIVKIAKEIDINLPIVSVINMIIDKYQIYDKLTKIANINENMVRIDNLIDNFSELSDLGYSISEIISYLEDTDDMDIGIKYASKGVSGNAVKIMNIHKSKGLEFSLCYFTGMHNKFTISEVKSKFLISDKYGVILPYICDKELCNTILRDLYVNDYYTKEISEKIRLLYVALTRCREKMIILANMEEYTNPYHKLVPVNVRLRWRSFLDILKSIDLSKYMTIKVGEYTKAYNQVKLKDINKIKATPTIDKHDLKIDYCLVNDRRFAKGSQELFDVSDIRKLEAGTKIHEILEYDDFFNPESIYAKNLINLIPDKFLRVYHEYEFKYRYENDEYHGIIDLMVEYPEMLYIIDYKLKETDKIDYIKQLKGYADYIKTISDKDIKCYLYSISDNVLTEV